MGNYFSTNLATLLKSAKMTQTDLAARLGLKPQAVNRYLSGKNFPSLDILLSLCDIFGKTLDELIRTDLSEHPFKVEDAIDDYRRTENIDRLIEALDRLREELKKKNNKKP